MFAFPFANYFQQSLRSELSFRGVGNPCPLLLVGLPASVITFGENLDVAAIAEGYEEAAL